MILLISQTKKVLQYTTNLPNIEPGVASLFVCRPLLKPGHLVVNWRDLPPKVVHFNGIWYIVYSMSDNFLFWHISTIRSNGKRLMFTLIACDPGGDHFPNPGFRRTWFSLRTCFASIVNKAQLISLWGSIWTSFTRKRLYTLLAACCCVGHFPFFKHIIL